MECSELIHYLHQAHSPGGGIAAQSLPGDVTTPVGGFEGSRHVAAYARVIGASSPHSVATVSIKKGTFCKQLTTSDKLLTGLAPGGQLGLSLVAINEAVRKGLRRTTETRTNPYSGGNNRTECQHAKLNPKARGAYLHIARTLQSCARRSRSVSSLSVRF